MKIVDVCAFYAPRGGGVRTYIDRKLALAPALGHDLTVIAPGPADGFERRERGAAIRWIAAPSFPLDRAYRYFDDPLVLHRALDAERPDIVEVSSPWRSASYVADWQGPAPRVLVMHADPLSAYAYRWFDQVASRPTIDRHFGWFWRHLLRLDSSFAQVVSASASLSRRLREGGLRNVVTIPMGVEPGLLSPMLRDEMLRAGMLASCGLGSDARLLLGVGRLAPEKRWPMVIEAVTAAACRLPVGLVLLGAGRDRSRVVKAIGSNPHIRLLEPTADRRAIARLMASVDGLIHGCESETFCMVAAEAKASGLPLIVPDEGGASDQAVPGRDFRYLAASAQSAAAAVLRFAHEAPAPDRAAQPCAIDDHFRELFGGYLRIAGDKKAA